MPKRLDGTDLRILKILREDATTSKADIARRVAIVPSAVHERIRKLERSGVIRGYTVRTDPDAFGPTILAYVFVTESKPVTGRPTGELLAALEGVEEVHKIAGEDCFLVKVRTGSTKELAAFLDDQVMRIPSVRATRTTIVLGTIKE